MGAVANITEMSNSGTTVQYGKIARDLMAPAFVKSTTMTNLMKVVAVGNTPVKNFYKEGTLTAALVAESNPAPINANGELTRSNVTSTAAKAVVSSGISVEAERFTDLDLPTIAAAQGSAIGRYVDNDAIGMFGSLSQTVTAAAGLTIDDVMLAELAIRQAEVPNKEVPLAVVLAHKGYYNIKKEIMTSGATVWANPQFIDLVQGQVSPNNFVGSLPGLNFYATSGHSTSGGDNIQAVFHPLWTFAAQLDDAPSLASSFKGTEGLYTEAVSFYFYDIIEWNDVAGVQLLSDS